VKCKSTGSGQEQYHLSQEAFFRAGARADYAPFAILLYTPTDFESIGSEQNGTTTSQNYQYLQHGCAVSPPRVVTLIESRGLLWLSNRIATGGQCANDTASLQFIDA